MIFVDTLTRSPRQREDRRLGQEDYLIHAEPVGLHVTAFSPHICPCEMWSLSCHKPARLRHMGLSRSGLKKRPYWARFKACSEASEGVGCGKSKRRSHGP